MKFLIRSIARSAASRTANADDLDFLHGNLNHCSLKWILSPEPLLNEKNPLEPMSIESMMESFMTSKASFIEHCKVTPEQIS